MTASGTQANRHGRLQAVVAAELDNHGYQQIEPPQFIVAVRILRQPIYARQVTLGYSIYDKPRQVDFLLFHPLKQPSGLVIQCKWQSSSGSVDEKFPFEVLSIQRGDYDAMVVLDGDGYSEPSERWLREQAGDRRLRHVVDVGGFYRAFTAGIL